MRSRIFDPAATLLLLLLLSPRLAQAQVPTWSSPGAAPAPAPPPPNSPARDRADETKPNGSYRREWLLSVEAVTHAPVDVGAQLGLETPQRLRLFAGYGWVPGGYMSLLTNVAANASGNSYAQALLQDSDYSGRTWRVQAGVRPFRNLGLYLDFGYARLSADGALDLADSNVPQLAALGGGYRSNTRLDMWLLELGYQGQIADRLVLAGALGVMHTFNATTHIDAVRGAPTNEAILTSAANQADAALEKYGTVPTLTLRLGFDLI